MSHHSFYPIRQAPNLRIYGEYALNYKPAISKIQNFKRNNTDFKTFLSQVQQKEEFQRNILAGLDLEDLLSEPLNRLPTYRFYLEMFSRATPATHPDYDGLIEAFAIMATSYMHVNYCNLQSESVSDLQTLQQVVTGLPPSVRLPSPQLPLLSLCIYVRASPDG